MRFVHRFLGLSVASLALLGILGCGEDNEKEVRNESQGKVTVDPKVPSSYDGMAPKASGANPYAAGGAGNYPGANTSGGGGGGAPKK